MALVFSTELISEAESAIRQYGEARKRFRIVQAKLESSGLLFGNDNKVGIAGEYWALRFYLSLGFEIEELPKHTNNPSFDFIVSRSGKGATKVQVKAITAENKRGTTSQVKIDSRWDELCVVELSDELFPIRVGVAGQDAFRTRCKAPSGMMSTNRKWLDEDWMITRAAEFAGRS